jgi:hypothetical protein
MSKHDLLSKRSNVYAKTEHTDRHIVCISGGVASAYVAWWAKNNIEKEVIYYFNDTHWEHKDLYRFLDDVEKTLNIKIFHHDDGRTPEQVFYDSRMLGSNRTPLCSRILKAEMLQKFVNPGDTLYFGIDPGEIHRAARIAPIYQRFGCEAKFPLIDNLITREDMFKKMEELNIEIPQMYKDGFTHNNCSGGCVRAGKKQWVALYGKYPEVYAERERMECEFSEHIGKPYTILKDMSLKELREAIESQMDFDFGDDEWQGECMGSCGKMY